MGTDRRFPNTRENIVPFTNVDKNTTVTFYDLSLVPEAGLYYFTVRAYSTSFSISTVTSNGFHVGYDGEILRKYNDFLFLQLRYLDHLREVLKKKEEKSLSGEILIFFYFVS